MATQQVADQRREKRRRAMLDAAEALFLENGYESTTLNDIVARSGGSLATLYDLFGGKPGLLTAMVNERCARIAEFINATQLGNRKPADALRAIARHLLDQLNDEAGIALFRVVISEMPRLPELGHRFYEAGPATASRLMARYLDDQAQAGTLEMDDPQEAAMLFIHMVIGDHHMRLLCGVPVRHDDSRLRHIDRAVEAFMSLHAKPQSNCSG